MPNNQAEKNQNYKTQDETKIEQQFLEGSKDPNLGVYSNMFSAKSRFNGQDGGVITALLVKGFEEHLFDAAIVVYRGDGYSAKAVVATNAKEAVAARGTRYLRVNVTKKLRETNQPRKKKDSHRLHTLRSKSRQKNTAIAKERMRNHGYRLILF